MKVDDCEYHRHCGLDPQSRICEKYSKESKVKEYKLYVIKDRDGLSVCPEFKVDNVQWNSTRSPCTTGRMGYIADEGIVVRMKCEETNPLATKTKNMEMVCFDSAMEAFFSFTDGDSVPTMDSLYFNFEINSNGALYAKSGYGRPNRAELLPSEMDLVAPKAWLTDEAWYMEITVPNQLLERFLEKPALSAGDVFYCNFYKVGQTPEIEHYMSYNYIAADKPNFHMPPYFAKAIVVSANK